jgi:hypothetical protein
MKRRKPRFPRPRIMAYHARLAIWLNAVSRRRRDVPRVFPRGLSGACAVLAIVVFANALDVTRVVFAQPSAALSQKAQAATEMIGTAQRQGTVRVIVEFAPYLPQDRMTATPRHAPKS